MRRRRQSGDAIRSIGLRGGFASIAAGFGSIGLGMGRTVRSMGSTSTNDSDGGRWIRRRPKLHDCDLPDLEGASMGDVWQCGECGSMWAVMKNDADGWRFMRVHDPAMWHTTANGDYWHTPHSTPYWWTSTTEWRSGSGE